MTGYVIISVLAFALGVLVTLLLRQLKDIRDAQKQQKKD